MALTLRDLNGPRRSVPLLPGIRAVAANASHWRVHAYVVVALCLVLVAPSAVAQTGADSHAASKSEMQQILDRLDQLEAQNRTLLAKIEELSAELQASRAAEQSPPAQAVQTSASTTSTTSDSERLATQEARTAELQQTKVEASQKFPIRLTGMALFNAFSDSRNSGGEAFPITAEPGGGAGGGTFRQTIVGLDFFGPRMFGGGRISGSVRMDFYGGSGQSFDQLFRLRTADIAIDWADRSFRLAMDKPLLSTRDPESLAQVGLPALSGAGNLWYWIPQARFEQVVHFKENTGIRADVAAVGTNEAAYTYVSSTTPYSTVPASTRPGVEGRVEFFTGSDARFEIAPAVHHSISHEEGLSLPTDIYSLDWLVRPVSAFELTGAAFTGTNTAALGGLQQGILVYFKSARAVHSTGGWTQLKWRASQRLWFNMFTGEEAPDLAGLPRGAIRRNLAYGANVFYRLAPNVLASFEVYQYRTTYVPTVTLLANHYDLALAYQF